MLTRISPAEMEALLRKEHPQWTDEALRSLAWRYVETLDPRLDVPLARYAATGEQSEVTAGEFSLLAIRALRRCGYLEAALLLDG